MVKIGEPWNPEVSIYEFKRIVKAVRVIMDLINTHSAVSITATPPDTARQAEWLDRGAIALKLMRVSLLAGDY